MTDFAATFARIDREAWLPANYMSVSEWAEAHRVLSSRVSSEPGPYRLSRTPYLRAIHDDLGNTRYREIDIVAPAQSGKSECARNWIGQIVDMSPAPIMIVFPTEAAAKENMEERVIPMFSDSPRLAKLLTGRSWDVKKGRVRLRTCDIFVGWAGSAQALATRPICFVVLDEVDKMKRYSGREADPCSLARVRTRTYSHRGKVLLVSTPTIPTGTIWVSYQACPDRRTWHVPCPRCGAWAEMEWGQVRWEGMEASDAEALLQQLSAFASGLLQASYACPSCEELIPDSERWGMVLAGEWVSEGHPRGERPPAEAVGYRISGLSTPWTSFTELAREWIAARLKGLGELQHFYNSMLGLPFWGANSEGSATEIEAGEVYRKGEAGHERGVVPSWATILVASSDTGKRDHPWAVRAYGRGYQSRLIDEGIADSYEELRRCTLDRGFRVEGVPGLVKPQILVKDAGGGEGPDDATTTEQVYRFALTDSVHIKPIKGFGGAGTPLKPVSTHKHEYKPPGVDSTPFDVTISIVDTGYFKDLVASRVQHEDPTVWETHAGLSREYVMQVASERKTLVHRIIKPDGEVKEVWRWVLKAQGSANHFWDAEVYSAVGAYMLEADREEPSWPTTAPAPEEEEEEGSYWTGAREGAWEL